MKDVKQKELFLEQLKKMPIIQIACKNSGISRATIYRWKKEDKEFAKNMNGAILEGETFITDVSESQLISMIKDKNFPAIQLWLRTHHPKYGNKIELLGNLKIENEPLTVEQQEIVRRALQLAGLEDKEN